MVAGPKDGGCGRQGSSVDGVVMGGWGVIGNCVLVSSWRRLWAQEGGGLGALTGFCWHQGAGWATGGGKLAPACVAVVMRGRGVGSCSAGAGVLVRGCFGRSVPIFLPASLSTCVWLFFGRRSCCQLAVNSLPHVRLMPSQCGIGSSDERKVGYCPLATGRPARCTCAALGCNT